MDITERIRKALDEVEQQEQITVLYACESGSRAWGFASTDSDYDVRFLYVRRTECYLTIQDRADVIEKPIQDELDIAGWDLPKALKLLRKSNPPLLEWLQSPIVYRQQSSLVNRLLTLMPEYYSPIACMHHYCRMAQNNYREYLQGEEVRLKKYFYALRPVLACLWIEQDRGVVPMELAALVEGLLDDVHLRAEIESLLEAKRNGHELDRGPRLPQLSEFLDMQLARLAAGHQRPQEKRDPGQLDEVFLAVLAEVNGPHLRPV